MRDGKTVIAMLAAGSLVLGAGLALTSTALAKTEGMSQPSAARVATKSETHRIRGEVTSVEPGAKTMVVKAMEGKKELTVGVDISEKTMIREGKATRSLADVKVGDTVWMKYERANDKLVADVIHILKPASMAAKSKSY